MDTTTPSLELTQAAQALDQSFHAAMARRGAGLSPVSMARAWTDWVLNLAVSPGTQALLVTQAQRLALDWLAQTRPLTHPSSDAAGDAIPGSLVHALAADARFRDPAWRAQPWQALASANKAWELWWKQAADLRGMEPHSREQMHFFAGQWLDMLSPGNWLASNPQALQRALETGGQSLAQGLSHAVDDWRERHHLPPLQPTEAPLSPGAGLAMTEGDVVMRNDLVELIRYHPSTDKVQAEPVLIVPSCIMKYYILDLSPHNSMVRWLTGQGHTVYIVSWRNPDENDALLQFDDYVRHGVLDPLDHVHTVHQRAVHLTGYCLGGTFTAIAAAALAHRPSADGPALASLTLLAAETDFTEPGEMGVLIDNAQVEMLEHMMAEQGFLSGPQMAGSFQFLHSRDLVWTRRTQSVLLGEPPYSSDLMVWNADVTRLPAVMHSQHLRQMYLANALAQGHYEFEGEAVSLRNLHLPMFVVGTAKDHVSPWQSVFKIHQLVDSDVTFVLTNGGHNAGIVSQPGHPRRHFQMQTTARRQRRPTPDQWAATAPHQSGSWWEAWSSWLGSQGSGDWQDASAKPEPALYPAPGEYVMTRYED